MSLYSKTNESRLWRFVVVRALFDAAYGGSQERLKVAKWVADTDSSGDFDTVCHFAGIDTEVMAQQFADMMVAPKAVRIVTAVKIRRAIMAKDSSDALTDPDLVI